MRLFPSQRSHGRVALLRDRGETTHSPFLAVAQERDPPVPSDRGELHVLGGDAFETEFGEGIVIELGAFDGEAI